MPWMLQPHNYLQSMRPNLYNVAYRRISGYKGMGRLGNGSGTDAITGGQCPGSPGCPGYVDPYNNLANIVGTLTDPSGTSTPYSLISSDALNQLLQGSVSAPGTTGLSPTILLIAGGVLVFLVAMSMGRR